MIYLLSIPFTLAFVFYSKFQFSDTKGNTNKKWKRFGWIMRVLFFVSCWLLQRHPSTWQDYGIAGSICILLFEMGINVIALQAPLFHIGTTGTIDKGMGKYKWVAWFGLLIISIILKIIT